MGHVWFAILKMDMGMRSTRATQCSQLEQKAEPILPMPLRTGQPIQVLHAVRTGVSAEAGRGRATVPPPKPHP